MKIALSGASGFVGTKIQETFEDVVIIDRKDNVTDIKKKLQGVSVVINLAGAPIIKKWSDEYKKLLYNSRIETTKKIVQAINESEVEQFISTSAVGAYPSDQICDVDSTLGDDFLANLAKDWEDEAKKAKIPTSILRFGIILGKEGGALAQMLTPFKLGVGGVIADGKMMMSWLDIEDLIRLYQWLIENKKEGTFNAVSPRPITNKKFTKTLGKVLGKPTIFPLPKFVLKLIFGEASAVLTDSKEVYPNRLKKEGFEFKYPTIEESLIHLLS